MYQGILYKELLHSHSNCTSYLQKGRVMAGHMYKTVINMFYVKNRDKEKDTGLFKICM